MLQGTEVVLRPDPSVVVSASRQSDSNIVVTDTEPKV